MCCPCLTRDTVSAGTDIPAFDGAGMSVGPPTVVNVTNTRGSFALPDIADVRLGDADFTVVDVETTGWSPDRAGHHRDRRRPCPPGRGHRGVHVAGQPGDPRPRADHGAHRDHRSDAGPCPARRRRAARLAGVRRGQCAHRAQRPVRHRVPDRGVRRRGAQLAGLRGARHAAARQVPGGHAGRGADCKLRTLAGYFGAPVQPSHRALDDARATATVLGGLLGRRRRPRGPHARRARRLAPSSETPRRRPRVPRRTRGP